MLSRAPKWVATGPAHPATGSQLYQIRPTRPAPGPGDHLRWSLLEFCIRSAALSMGCRHPKAADGIWSHLCVLDATGELTDPCCPRLLEKPRAKQFRPSNALFSSAGTLVIDFPGKGEDPPLARRRRAARPQGGGQVRKTGRLVPSVT